MAQEIITWIIIIAAIIIAGYKFYHSVIANKKSSGTCGGCSNCGDGECKTTE